MKLVITRNIILFSILALAPCVQAAPEAPSMPNPAVRRPQATPVVFLHSLGGSPTQWQAQVARIQDQRPATALTLGGHGNEALPDSNAPAIEDLSRQLQARLDAASLPQFVVVAHSAAAAVAISLASQQPARVKGLFLCDPVGDFRAIPTSEFDSFLASIRSDDHRGVLRQFWQSILTGASADVRTAVLADLEVTPQGTFVYTYSALRRFDPAATLAGFDGPVRIVNSSMNDAPYSLHKIIVGLRTTVIPNTSHWIHMDRPVEFNALLDEFLSEVDAKAQ